MPTWKGTAGPEINYRVLLRRRAVKILKEKEWQINEIAKVLNVSEYVIWNDLTSLKK